MATDVRWWKRPFPNQWVAVGAIGLVIFGSSVLLRWADGPDSYDNLGMWGSLTLVAAAVLAFGLLRAHQHQA